MRVLKEIKELSKKMNKKAAEEKYRYYIRIDNKEVVVIKVKSNVNLISKIGYFNNEEDCKEIVKRYEKEILKLV